METAEVQQGPGEFEITFQPKFGIESADNMLMFRDAVSVIIMRLMHKGSDWIKLIFAPSPVHIE